MSFAALNRLVNPMVKWLLGSPFRGALSERLLVLAYTGAKSGLKRSLPVQYAEAGRGSDQEIVILVGEAEKKRWWRNLRRRAPVRVLVRGQWRDADAVALPGRKDAAVVAAKLDAYFKRFPRAASYYGISRDASGRADPEKLRACAETAVVVAVTPSRRLKNRV